MKKILLKSSLICILIAFTGILPQRLFAQSACAGAGETVGPAAEFGNSTYAIGDLTVVDGGADPADVNDADWYLGAGANVDVYAAVTIPAGTVVRLKAGAVLNVYGDFTNNGYLFVEPGATINFYGATWTNATTAVVGDGATAANTTAGGAVNFIAPRPAVPASVSPTACVLASYSGGNFAQNIDGGNVPMDIAMHIQNANNINLVNSNTKLEGTVTFDVVSGDVNLGNNNFVFTANGTWSSNVAPNAAYFLTNGTAACAGAVEKLGLPAGQTFTFPIGRAETYSGGRDYTPAMIRNDGSAPDNFQVRVKNYADAIAIGGIQIDAPQEGIDRVWQITSTNGSGVTMSLQHNSATNGTTYQSVFGSDPTAFITQYQGAGTWNVGNTPTAMTGTVSGSQVHTMGYSVTTTATSCTDPKSWFTKSNDLVSPLPVTITGISAKAQECSAVIRWTTEAEVNMSRYEVEYSSNGSTFVKAGTVAAKNVTTASAYSFSYAQGTGTGYYRIKIINLDGTFKYSSVVNTKVSCDKAIIIYPNPTPDVLHITGLKAGDIMQVYNAAGQLMSNAKASGTNESISLSRFAAGTYEFVVIRDNANVLTAKVVKR